MISVTSADREFTGLGLNPDSNIPQEPTSSIRSQVIVTESQGQTLAFPSAWVEEVMLFPRQRLLKLPFYQSPVLGLIPHQGDLVLLLEYLSDASTEMKQLGQQENIRAMRLGSQVEHLAGSAILIDKILGTMDESEMGSHASLRLFSPNYISLESFSPYRWV